MANAERSIRQTVRQVVGTTLVRPVLRAPHSAWRELAPSAAPPGLGWFGDLLHRVGQSRAARQQSFTTFFFRNRPQLELMARLLSRRPKGSEVRIALVGCSKGC